MSILGHSGPSTAQGGGYPPGGDRPPTGGPPGGWGPPGSAPPPPPGYGPPGGGGASGWGPPGGAPPYGSSFAPPPYHSAPRSAGPVFEGTEAIAFGFQAVTQNFSGVGLPLAVAALVFSVPNFVLSMGRAALVALLSQSISAPLLMVMNLGGGAVTWLVSVIAQAYVMGGIVQFSLCVARGERPEFGVVLNGGRYFVPMLGGTLLYGLGVAAGSVLCLVPGLFLAGSWVAYSAFIVDQGMSPIAALSSSWQATAPYRTNAFIYILLYGAVFLAGLIACGVGALLLSFPLLMISNAYLYLKLSGEEPRLPARLDFRGPGG